MNLIFEDDQLLVINKPPGYITEGPEKDGISSISAQATAQFGQKVFPCHRLDKDTTGVLLFAKSKAVLRNISEQFAKRSVRKSYWVCVDGEWNKQWNRVESKIERSEKGWKNSSEGKSAVTTFRRLAYWNNRSFLEALPKTGRTHQIRLHCLFQDCPVSGDGVYGQRLDTQPSMALHAASLRLAHPVTKALLHMKAPLPAYWQEFWLLDCPIEIE